MSGDETADPKNVAQPKRRVQSLTRPTRLMLEVRISVSNRRSHPYFVKKTLYPAWRLLVKHSHLGMQKEVS